MRRKDRGEYLQKIFSLILAVFTLLLLMVFLRMLIFDKKVSHDRSKEISSQTEKRQINREKVQKEEKEEKVEAEEEGQEQSNQKEWLSLTEDDKYRGNLILVNYQYPYHFEQNRETANLVNIKDYQGISYPVGKEDMQLRQSVLPALDTMIGALKSELVNSSIGVSSAYRSQEYQMAIFAQYEQEYGRDYAKAYVANPGNSEHHTGLALDFGIYYEDGSEGTFSESESALWMANNSYRYGFIRRYQAEKAAITKINNESWHFRYVGIAHASYMQANQLCLEEYVDYLRNTTSKESPLQITTENGEVYLVYASKEMQMEKPSGEYEVSGDNIDGYIITERLS